MKTAANSLLKIAVNRLKLIPISIGPVSSKKKVTFLSELASLGYLIENDEKYNDTALRHYPALIEQLNHKISKHIEASGWKLAVICIQANMKIDFQKRITPLIAFAIRKLRRLAR